jgi:hypothetical protein
MTLRSTTNLRKGTFYIEVAAPAVVAWTMTNGIRIELARQGTPVVAVHAGFIDADMAMGIDVPKISPPKPSHRCLTRSRSASSRC